MTEPLEPIFPNITAINLSERVALDDKGVSHRIDVMFDGNGDETENAEAAVAVVVKVTGGGFMTLDCRAFERVRAH
jgi:hypothetical protein